MLVPNILGCIIASGQLSLFAIYHSSSSQKYIVCMHTGGTHGGFASGGTKSCLWHLLRDVGRKSAPAAPPELSPGLSVLI